MSLETNPAKAIESLLRRDGHSAREAKAIIAGAREAYRQQAQGSADESHSAEGNENMSNEIVELVGDLNKAFANFKEKHESDVSVLQKAVDDMAIQRAADQMGGNSKATAEAPADGVRAMRTHAEFQAHYGKGAGAREVNDAVPLSEFMRGVAGMKTSESAIKALSEGTDSAGGYSVPNIVMPRILDAMVPASSLLQAGAGFVPLDKGAKTATTAVTDTLPVAAWRDELGSIAESDPTFRAVVATPRSLACIVRISRELLADGVDIDRAIRAAIG